jgi:hypothetical protein
MAVDLALILALLIKIPNCFAIYKNYTDWTEVPSNSIFCVDKPREQKRTIFHLNVIECTKNTRVTIFVAKNSSEDDARRIGHFNIESNYEYFINCELGEDRYIKLSLDTLADFEVDLNHSMPGTLNEYQKYVFIST